MLSVYVGKVEVREFFETLSVYLDKVEVREFFETLSVYLDKVEVKGNSLRCCPYM